MLVKVNGKIENLENIKTITVEDVYLKDIYEGGAYDLARAIFGIAISIATEEAVKRYELNYLAEQQESELALMESTKHKVKEYALEKLSDIFDAKDLDYI